MSEPPSQEVEQLRQALISNRRISLAIGIIMRDQGLDEERAFSVLRRLSQDNNRKLREVAEDVITWRRLPPRMGANAHTSPRRPT